MIGTTVLDFGLAKAWSIDPGSGVVSDVSHSPTLTRMGTRAGVILGTAPYMSPEQARGRPVDKRTDVWAFGVVLLEMLTGRRPFVGETVTDVLAAVLTSEIRFDSLPEEAPPAVRRLLRRCLQRDPKNRLHDIADARIVLDELESGRSEEPAPVAPPTRPGSRAALAIAAVPVSAALGALLTVMALPDRPPPPEPVRIQRLTFSARDHAPSVSPDGRFVAFTSNRDAVPRIWLKQMEGGGEQGLTEGPDSRPRFSPDGNSLGFLRESEPGRHDLYRTALLGGQPRRLLANVNDFDWSPDGRSVALVRQLEDVGREDVSILEVVELETGRERTLLEIEGGTLLGPRWRPDGGRIAVTRGGAINSPGGWGLLLVDPATGASEDLGVLDGPGMISSSSWNRSGTGLLYAASPNDIGDMTGTPAAVRLVVPGAPPRTLFWAPGLFPPGGFPATPAVFSILGRDRLVFDARQQSQELREVDRLSGASRQLTRTLALDRQPAYSRDGRLVVFSSNRTGNLDLWLLDRESLSLRQLTDDASQDWDPSFSVDSRRVLFSSSRGGSLEIWSIDLDGSNARQLSADGVNAENPTMTRDGRWVVYSSGNPDHAGLFRIRSDGSEAERITTGNHSTPEVSPDGRWAMFIEVAGMSARVRFVEVETGRLVAAAIDLGSTARAASITIGRGRWTRGGSRRGLRGRRRSGAHGHFRAGFRSRPRHLRDPPTAGRLLRRRPDRVLRQRSRRLEDRPRRDSRVPEPDAGRGASRIPALIAGW